MEGGLSNPIFYFLLISVKIPLRATPTMAAKLRLLSNPYIALWLEI